MRAARALVVDQLAHQQFAQTAALEVGAHDDAELGIDVVRVGHGAHHAQRLLLAGGVRRIGADRHKRHLALVVDLGQARQLAAFDAAPAVEHAHADVFVVQVLQELEVLRFVLGADRPQHQVMAVPWHGLHQIGRIRPDREVVGAGRRVGAQLDTRVECQRTLVVDDQRVDVELGDLRHIGQQLRYRHQHAVQGVEVHRRCIAPAVQQPGHPSALDQRAGQREVERRQRHRAVGQQFDRRAALAEQDHRPEHPVDRCADDQLLRVRAVHHGLHREALDTRSRQRLADPRQHRLGRQLHRLRAVEVEHHTADVGLVRDVFRQDLQRHRETHRLCATGRGRALRLDRACRHGVDPVGGEHGFRLRLGHHRAAAGQHLLHQGARSGGIGTEPGVCHRRRLHQLRLVAPVRHTEGKGPHRLLRRLVTRDAGVLEHLARLRHGGLAEPAADQARWRPGCEREQCARDLGAGDDCCRCVDEQHRARGGVVVQRLQGLHITLHRCVADDVHRVAV